MRPRMAEKRLNMPTDWTDGEDRAMAAWMGAGPHDPRPDDEDAPTPDEQCVLCGEDALPAGGPFCVSTASGGLIAPVCAACIEARQRGLAM